MRRWLFILLLLAFLIGLGAYLLWRLPRLREVSPSPGARLVTEGTSLRLRFSRRMQTASVASHLKIDPPREGKFTWEDNTLTFTPETLWPGGITVTVQLKAGAYAAGFPPLPMLGSKTWAFGISKPMLAYLWPANLPADIFALDPVSGEILRLTDGANVQDFSVSADGASLYYSAVTETGKSDLFRLSWRDGSITRILSCPDANCHAVQISPTGDYLAYERVAVRSPGQPDYPQVWMLSLSGGELNLAGNDSHETILPDWSPDGRLAFYDRTEQAFILLDPRSQERHPFLNQTGEQGGWTSDGQAYVAPEITFVPLRDGTEVPHQPPAALRLDNRPDHRSDWSSRPGRFISSLFAGWQATGLCPPVPRPRPVDDRPPIVAG